MFADRVSERHDTPKPLGHGVTRLRGPLCRGGQLAKGATRRHLTASA
jgi:hypothetical protein